MAILINAHQLTKAYSARPLFDDISFSIESKEHIGLIGPNGAGKSTLLKILAQKISPDDGTLAVQKNLKIGFLEQVPEFESGSTLFSTLVPDISDWERTAKAQEFMSKLGLIPENGIHPETLVAHLSGGWRKKVAFARELMKEPDLLLLDEPTNHLDVDTILLLEELIVDADFATLAVTHDRAFLQKTSTRIIELDRRNPNGLLSSNGDFAQFLETKEQLLTAQEKQETRLRNTLRRETEWLRQGAKARTTKQQARIQRADELKDSVQELAYRNQSSQVRLDFQSAERNPKKLISAEGICKSYGSTSIVPPLDLVITAKSRIGLLGANGCGKTTLIKLLLEQEATDSGKVTHAEQLQVAYFEQNRETLDPELSIMQTICPDGDSVDFRGSRIHIRSYLGRFLFTPGQMEMAVGKLSGGEQSRVLLAKLMLKEANLLVLDEPTNDLDMETLHVLEDVLQEFNGAILIVTHDRFFLDQVSNQILAFGLNAKMEKEIVSFSSLSQWEKYFQTQRRLQREALNPKLNPTKPSSSAKKAKLGFKEQYEYDHMESNIHQAEAKLAELAIESQRAENLSNASKLNEITQEMSALEKKIETLYSRWSELESRV